MTGFGVVVVGVFFCFFWGGGGGGGIGWWSRPCPFLVWYLFVTGS